MHSITYHTQTYINLKNKKTKLQKMSQIDESTNKHIAI